MIELTEVVKGLLEKTMQGHNNSSGHQTHDDRDAFMLKAEWEKVAALEKEKKASDELHSQEMSAKDKEQLNSRAAIISRTIKQEDKAKDIKALIKANQEVTTKQYIHNQNTQDYTRRRAAIYNQQHRADLLAQRNDEIGKNNTARY
jgi:hypothetical protein